MSPIAQAPPSSSSADESPDLDTTDAVQVDTSLLGRSGVPVSRLTLGTMNFGGATAETQSQEIIRTALDAGITLIDTADVYHQGLSEEIVGRTIVGKRDDLFLATKVHGQIGTSSFNAGNSRRWVTRAVEGSLRRLGTDRIDLYQVHRPEPQTDLREILFTFNDLIRQGKILYYGTSAFGVDQIVELQLLAREYGLEPPLTEQLPYSALIRLAERTTLPVARRYRLGVLSYGPLAAGWLNGEYRVGADQPVSSRSATAWNGRFDIAAPENGPKLTAADAFGRLADEAGVGVPELAVAFALNHPAITSVIAGPRTGEHLDTYLRASQLTLDGDLLDAIDEAVAPGTSFHERDNGRIPAELTPAALRRDHT